MVRTFLQVAAGAADIPVTRLLGQSPAGLSATGDSDTRNYYDMVSSRQEIDLRPQLERLDRLILRSAGLDPASLTFEFRPLWQLDAAEKATVALSKAQASAVYTGLNLWPGEVTAKLVQAQLVEDGIYLNAETIFAEARAVAPGRVEGQSSPDAMRGATPSPVADFDPDQPRDPRGRWTSGGGAMSSSPENYVLGRTAGASQKQSSSEAGGVLGLLNMLNPIGTASAAEINPEPSPPIAETNPRLRRIHPDSTYDSDSGARQSLDYWRNQSTDEIIKSFKDNPTEPLKMTTTGATSLMHEARAVRQ